MGIAALPETTVRVLGASQVLTDPAAAVKELLDNAYDANATSIALEIHSNTIDVIQVRDNGHGIAPEDRAMIARRYCTSKISHDEDLKDIGGSSLGFRGEALASAAELSGSLTISTKIEGEQVAVALKISQKGEVVGQEKVSLPVGTTVRITDFIKANPVRRQVVLKSTENCLKKIKRTMQAYAFARPHVRLALRVLKAKNNKGDWVYAPKMNGNAEDAAFKVVGAACASQCTWSVLEYAGYTFEAFLPRPDSDASKISNVGPFISVDARPVSAARGIFKQICKTYRETLKGAGVNLADIKDPFLYLGISCPRGSYDANLEPAKDDLLFEDSSVVVETARKLFVAAYEQEDILVMRPEAADLPRQQLQQDLDDISSSTPARPQSDEAGEHHVQISHDGPPIREASQTPRSGVFLNAADELPARGTHRSNMYGCDNENLEMLYQRPPTGHTEAEFEELRRSRNDVTVSNPWITAKLHASLKRSTPSSDDQSQHVMNSDAFTTPAVLSSSPLKQNHQRDLWTPALPTPQASSPSLHGGFHPSAHVPDARLARDGRLIGSPALPQPRAYRAEIAAEPGRPPENNYSSMTDPGTPTAAIPDISSRLRRSPRKVLPQGQLNKPFVSPMIDHSPRDNVWFDHLQEAERPRDRQRRPRPYVDKDNSCLVAQGELGDLADDPRNLTPPRRNRDIRDFVGKDASQSIASVMERRNYNQPASARADPSASHDAPDLTGDARNDEDIPQQRGFVPASEIMNLEERVGDLNPHIKHPPKRRKTGERRALRELDPNASIASPPKVVETADEEEYHPGTSKRAASRRKSSTKLGRTKSSRLPLERTPAGQGTHDLTISYNTSPHTFSSSMCAKLDIAGAFLGYNEPALPTAKGLEAAASCLSSLTATLHRLLVDAGGDTNSTSPSGLFAEVKAAFARRIEESDGPEDDEMLMSVAT